MLVKLRRDGMSGEVVTRIALVWLAISVLLVVVNLGLIANKPQPETDDTLWLMPLLSPIIGVALAEMVAFVAVPLLTLGIAMLLGARLAWRVIGEREVVMTCLAMALSVPLLFQMGPLRVDHYGWQVVCALIAMNGLAARSPGAGGWIAGLAIATWIAISIDGWPLAASICAIAALKWLRNRADRMWLVHITQALAVGLIAIFLGSRGWTELGAYCDAIGLTHIAMLCWAALVLSALSRVGPIPTGALLGGFSLAAGGALGIYFLGGSSCMAVSVPLWRQDLAVVLENITLPLIGIWSALQLAARNGDWLRRWWFDYALVLIAALVVTIFAADAGALAGALAAVPLGWQLRLWINHIGQMKNPLKRAIVLVLLAGLLMPSLVLKLIPMIDPARADHNVAHSTASLGIVLPHS